MTIDELINRLEDHIGHIIKVSPSTELGWGISLYCETCNDVFFDVAWTI